MNRHKLCNQQVRSIPLRTHNIIRHIDLNRILLLSVGLWPYHQSNLGQFHIVLCLGILISFIGFLFSRFLVVDCTFDFVVKILSLALLFVMLTIGYTSFWLNNKAAKYLLDHMYTMYEKLEDKTEIAILDKYIYNAKRYTIKLILFAVCGLCPIICSAFMPFLLDMIVAKNESYVQRSKEIISTFFSVQEKYFYVIILHLNVAFSIGVIAGIAAATMLLVYFKQACGLFKISSYRIKRAMAFNVLENDTLKNEILMYKGIIHAVDIHRIAMEYATYVICCCEGTFLALIAVTVICLSLNLFRIVHMTWQANGIDEMFFVHVIIVIIIILCMFLSNYAGQEITDHNNDVFFTAYNVGWYLAPIHVQKLILFLLQRGSKLFCLNVCGLFAASLECFASLMSASISYFTVILSVQ